MKKINIIFFIILLSGCNVHKNNYLNPESNGFFTLLCCRGDRTADMRLYEFLGITIVSPDSINFSLKVHSYEVLVEREKQVIKRWKLKGPAFNRKVYNYFKTELKIGDVVKIESVIGLTPKKEAINVKGVLINVFEDSPY